MCLWLIPSEKSPANIHADVNNICMHICIQTRYFANIHAHMHTNIYTYIHTYIHTWKHAYIATCIHTCISIYAYIHTYIHASILTIVIHSLIIHTSRGVHPPEAMMHFPHVSDSPCFRKMSSLRGKFPKFYLF